MVGSAVLTGAAAWLGWWTSGGGWLSVVPALLLSGFVAYVTFGLYVPAAFMWSDAGSVRQAKRRLRDAERDGRRVAALGARAQMRLVRWRRRG